MIVSLFRASLPLLIITTWLGLLLPGSASDDLPRSSYVGPLRIPLASYERLPIGTVLAHPDRYQMREIRLTGTVAAIQTKTITNRLICGSAHERTTLMVEDDSEQIEIIDQGACGKNVSSLKASMLKIGQQVDLLVLITIPTRSDIYGLALEVTISFLGEVRD